MYSGTTLTPISGRLLGAHQKIDRVARDDLRGLLKNDKVFPGIRKILHFEGMNGPDGIKRKSPSQNEPWHYIDLLNKDDSQLMDAIAAHYAALVSALKDHNNERSAFEAAWLAHALVDGLTPAHHYPYEEKLLELRGGEGLETRTSFKEKVVMRGDTRRERAKNNWKMWGPKGLITTHGLFEFGVATLIAPLRLKKAMPSKEAIANFQAVGINSCFLQKAKEISTMGIYEAYYEKGWTASLARQIRQLLAPSIVEMVTLSWYNAAFDAGLIGKQSHAHH